MPLDPLVVRRLRRTRSAPPGRASSDPARARRYTAGLEQFEELIQAAADVAPSARPLPLFYALAQGGYAIAAARLGYRDGRLKESHGIAAGDTPARASRLTVSPTRSGALVDVTAALGSALPRPDITIDALWSALPESTGDPFPDSTASPVLQVRPHDRPNMGMAFLQMTRHVRADVGPIPRSVMDGPEPLIELGALLDSYPSAQGWSIEGDANPFVRISADKALVRLHWDMPESSGSATARWRYLQDHIVTSVPGSHDVFYLPPGLGADNQVLHPLVIWWSLLFGLSVLARYHPDAWIPMLDVNTSEEATVLESILDDGLTTIPQLLLQALEAEAVR